MVFRPDMDAPRQRAHGGDLVLALNDQPAHRRQEPENGIVNRSRRSDRVSGEEAAAGLVGGPTDGFISFHQR